MSLSGLSSMADVRGELVRLLVPVFFPLEMEQAGIVPVIGLAEKLHEPFVDVRAVQLRLEPAVFLDAPVLADAQEHDAVDGALHRKVQLALGEVRISERDVAGEQVAPVFDLGQKGVVNRCRPLLELRGLGILVKRALEYGFAGKYGDEFIPFCRIVFVGEVEHAAGGCLVGLDGLYAAVVDGEFLEIGQNA